MSRTSSPIEITSEGAQPGPPDDAAKFRRLAEHRGAAIEFFEEVREFAELRARIGFAVGTDQGEPQARLGQAPQHRLDAREQGDFVEMPRLQLAHVPRDHRQFYARNLQLVKNLAKVGVAERLEILDAAEAEFVGDIVRMPPEPGKTVGERAVQVENDEGGHRR